MSCNTIKFDGCEIAGTTFEGRTLKISGIPTDGAKFTAYVKAVSGAVKATISGVIQGDTVYFSFKELEAFGRNRYLIEYWAELPDIGSEVVAVENFKIVGAGEGGCSSCGGTVSANVVFEKKEIAVQIAKSVVNFGGGYQDLTAYLPKAEAEQTYQHKGDYALKSEIPTIPPPQDLTPYALQTDLNDTQAEVASNQNAIQQINGTLSQKADVTFVNQKFADLIGSSPEALNTIYELAAAWESNQTGLSNLVTLVGQKADFTWVTENFQAKGDYLLPADLLPYQKTTDADLKYAAKNHTHSYNDLNDKPMLFDGTWGSLSGKPSTFTPSAHTHPASEISGLIDYSQQVELTANKAIDASYNGKTIIAAASITITFPSGLPDGFQCSIFVATGFTVTLATGTAFVGNGGKVTLASEKTASIVKRNATGNYILRGELS